MYRIHLRLLSTCLLMFYLFSGIVLSLLFCCLGSLHPNEDIKLDIIKALKFIRKEEKIENLMHFMFNLSNPNPKYIFKTNKGISVLHRSDFEAPIFPHISQAYYGMHLAAYSAKLNGEIFQSNITDKNFETNSNLKTKFHAESFIKNSNFSDNFDTSIKKKLEKIWWKKFGLSGWEGQIFSEGKPDGYKIGNKNLGRIDAYSDGDVFLARANNPFGDSIKWTQRNLEETKKNRKRRSAIQLLSMIKCTTGCKPIQYRQYGCYCGYSGTGIPRDGIDKCCMLHDHCYFLSDCPDFLIYFIPYLWKCYHHQPLCAFDHGQWGGPGSCASRLCKCDANLSKCLQNYICPRNRKTCQSRNFFTLLLEHF